MAPCRLIAVALWALLSVGASAVTPVLNADGTTNLTAAGCFLGGLTATGTGKATVTSDQATVSARISVVQPTALAARDQAASTATQVYNRVLQVNGIAPADVTTTSVSVNPQTVYNNNNGTSTVTGYQYTNQLQVVVKNLTGNALAAVLDTLVAAGGNDLSIDSVSFDLSDSLRNDQTAVARRAAIADAKAAAQLFAQELGVTLGRIATFSESPSSSPPTPIYAQAAIAQVAGNAATPTPVNPGTQDVSTSVTIAYNLC